eukprot:g76533.t1
MSKLPAGLSFEELRQDAKHLIRWCLQGDSMQRPSLEQVLQHRFIKGQGGTAPPEPESYPAFNNVLRCLSVRMRLHFFVSHYQVEASGDVAALSLSLRKHGALVWRDMDAKNLTGEGMKQGVADSDVIVIFLTSGVLTRLWCLMEIQWALEFDKPIIIVAETEQRFFAFDWVRWTQDRLDKLAGVWEVSTDLQCNYTTCKTKFPQVHAEIKKQLDAKTIIPSAAVPLRPRPWYAKFSRAQARQAASGAGGNLQSLCCYLRSLSTARSRKQPARSVLSVGNT